MERAEILKQLIGDYRKKIELYQQMISEFERELGVPVGAMETGGSSTETRKSADSGADAISFVRAYQFFGKSQPDAAKLLLELVGHPLTTDKIMEGLEKGGVKIGGASPAKKKANFYTILRRSNDTFGRAARNTWGLLGWPGIKKLEKDEADGGSDKVTKINAPLAVNE